MLDSTAISNSRLTYADELAELIVARCRRDDALLGGKLPTERQLASELGVTRTMVRNALAVLEAQGRISREVGRGTFLRSGVAGPGTLNLDRRGPDFDQVGPADVMEARRLFEPQVLALVVAWATPRDFQEMRRCLAGGASAENAAAFEKWDFALHHAIVAASRNQLLRSMYATIERARQGQMWGNLKLRSYSRERRDAYQAEHVEIVEALSARELTRAVAATEAHLDHVERNLLGPSGAAASIRGDGAG